MNQHNMLKIQTLIQLDILNVSIYPDVKNVIIIIGIKQYKVISKILTHARLSQCCLLIPPVVKGVPN